MDLSLINIGGPCKVTDVASVLYFEDDVQLVPNPVYRDVANNICGPDDGTLVDMTWTLRGRPKAIWNSTYRAALLPTTYLNMTAGGGRILGAANRAVQIDGTDGERYILHRAAVTKMPELFLGLGQPLYGEMEWTGYIKTAAALTDADAFMTQSTGQAWSQADYPTGNQEALCTGAWSGITGWSTVFAEEGFKISHELKLAPVKQGNITVDQRLVGYRAACMFKPQAPTSAQLITSLAHQNTGKGIGTRQSATAADFVITDGALSVTVKNAAVNKGNFTFSNKQNRPGEWGLISSITSPGNRLVCA